MFKKLVLLSLTLCLLSSAQSPVKLRQTRLSANVSVGVPAEFREMNEDEIVSKYRTLQRSLGLYTEQRGAADFGVTIKEIDDTEWSENDLPMLENFYKANVMENYSQVKFLQQGRRVVNGKEVIFLEFVGQIASENAYGNAVTGRYHFMQYAILEGNIVIFNFNCPSRLRTKWQQTAQAIMDSIKLSAS
ncbi:MAG: hypothetical protein AAF740_11505 [Bacteroidota bacterium]